MRVIAFLALYCTSNVSAAFSTSAKGIGLDDVTLHTLRHTFATRLKDAGVDPFTIRDLLGHKTIKMTDRYTHANPNLMRQAVNAITECCRERRKENQKAKMK